MCKIACALPENKPYRISNDSVWPLRNAEGKAWHEVKKEKKDEHRYPECYGSYGPEYRVDA